MGDLSRTGMDKIWLVLFLYKCTFKLAPELTSAYGRTFEKVTNIKRMWEAVSNNFLVVVVVNLFGYWKLKMVKMYQIIFRFYR